jgi:hypothetical protein
MLLKVIGILRTSIQKSPRLRPTSARNMHSKCILFLASTARRLNLCWDFRYKDQISICTLISMDRFPIHEFTECHLPSWMEELKIHLKDYLERGWIKPSTSEFASGVLFAIKPGTNKLRMCTDYRRLNTCYTKKIGFALLNIDNILNKLGHTCYFA